MAVVKAVLWPGCVEVGKTLQEEGCKLFAVTTVAEALILREQGITGEILVLGPSAKEDWEAAILQDIQLSVAQGEWVPALDHFAQEAGREAFIHLKLETGMGRTGFTGDKLRDLSEALKNASSITVMGAFTHLARGAQRDRRYTENQHVRFITAIISWKNWCTYSAETYCNSAQPWISRNIIMICKMELFWRHFPSPAFEGMLDLKDPWTAKAKITHLQKVPKGTNVGYQSLYKSKTTTNLAVVPVGYADGLNRAQICSPGNRGSG